MDTDTSSPPSTASPPRLPSLGAAPPPVLPPSRLASTAVPRGPEDEDGGESDDDVTSLYASAATITARRFDSPTATTAARVPTAPRRTGTNASETAPLVAEVDVASLVAAHPPRLAGASSRAPSAAASLGNTGGFMSSSSSSAFATIKPGGARVEQPLPLPNEPALSYATMTGAAAAPPTLPPKSSTDNVMSPGPLMSQYHLAVNMGAVTPTFIPSAPAEAHFAQSAEPLDASAATLVEHPLPQQLPTASQQQHPAGYNALASSAPATRPSSVAGGSTTAAASISSFGKGKDASARTSLPPWLARVVPASRPKQIACGACVLIVLGLLIFGIYLLVLVTSFTKPTVAFLRAQAPPAGSSRTPLNVDTATTTLRVNWDFVVSVANPNAFDVDLYDVQYAAYPSSAATSPSDLIANGTLASLRVPANSNNTEITIPVLFTWRIREPTQNAFLLSVLVACGVPPGLIPSNVPKPTNVVDGDKVSVFYTVDTGVDKLRIIGYRFKHQDSAAAKCPVRLDKIAQDAAGGIVNSVIGTVGSLIPKLNGPPPNVVGIEVPKVDLPKIEVPGVALPRF
ncbi:hypothetical protein H9P43_009126 [Blastocladiella emersonii ATCC 22665]|nr:hypothetical protein H9P43_009126 [Blastocladiella emersonii ATCC 22665]